MKRMAVLLVILLAAVVLTSGCTQTPSTEDNGNQITGKFTETQAEEEAIPILEEEMDQSWEEYESPMGHFEEELYGEV